MHGKEAGNGMGTGNRGSTVKGKGGRKAVPTTGVGIGMAMGPEGGLGAWGGQAASEQLPDFERRETGG